MTFKMTCLKCGTEYTGYRAICNTCMTTQAIEDQTKALQNLGQPARPQNIVDSTLSWIWVTVVWGFFIWLLIKVFA